VIRAAYLYLVGGVLAVSASLAHVDRVAGPDVLAARCFGSLVSWSCVVVLCRLFVLARRLRTIDGRL
jgi:hypothetical protein